MPKTYLRFVVEVDESDVRWLAGPFTHCRMLNDDKVLETYEADLAEATFEWFNEHLPCPPWDKGKWTRMAVSWFKEDAHLFIQKMWDLVFILNSHDYIVHMLRLHDPGMIVYEDEYQVVAETPMHRRNFGD